MDIAMATVTDTNTVMTNTFMKSSNTKKRTMIITIKIAVTVTVTVTPKKQITITCKGSFSTFSLTLWALLEWWFRQFLQNYWDGTGSIQWPR